MTFYCNEPKAIKIYDLLHIFFDEIEWGSEKSDLVYKDGLFLFEEKKIKLKTTEKYILEIYDALEAHYQPISSWGILSGVRPLKIVHQEKKKGKSDKEIFNKLKNSYRLSDNKARLLIEIASRQNKIYQGDRDKLALYISIPFCPSICSYCCFHTRSYEKRWAQKYLSNLHQDISYAKKRIKEQGKIVDCIYIGGGTPWVLEEDQLEELFGALSDFTKVKEITFEGGRTDVLTPKKAGLVSSFATRVCLNPQSLTRGITPLQGRPEADDMKKWVEYFKKEGLFVSSDLIAGLPGESLDEFLFSLEELIGLNPENITLHNLSLKKGAQLKKLPASASVGLMLEEGYTRLEKASYRPYYIYRQKNMVDRGENVGFEKENTASIYNIRMMEDAHEILSIGSNAVSKKIRNKQALRRATPKDINLYMKEKEIRKTIIDDLFL